MPRYLAASKQQVLERLQDDIQQRLSADQAQLLSQFAAAFYRMTPEADLILWRPDDLLGATLDTWEFIQEISATSSSIRVYNPDYERHGWQSSHSVVVLVCPDMPFIVDSVRLELNRQAISIHAISNVVLEIQRDKQHRVKGLNGPGANKEAVLRIEIDRHTSNERLSALQSALSNVLSQVRRVVDDFQPMLALLEDEISQLQKSTPETISAQAETLAFLQWMKSHFTFLGAERFHWVQQEDAQQLLPLADSKLGVLRECDDDCRDSLMPIDPQSMSLGCQTARIRFSKAAQKSRIHRPAHPDFIRIQTYDEAGQCSGELRFLGLYTSSVYVHSPCQIPVIREKIRWVLDTSGLYPSGHDWKELRQILETFPRDDLFQMSQEELSRVALGVLHIRERRQIRLFLHRDQEARYFSALVYVPRDIYSTELRLKVEAILKQGLECELAEFTTYFSESILARAQFTLRRADQQAVIDQVDLVGLERAIQTAARSWDEDLYDALVEALGEELGIHCYNQFGRGFSPGYRADFSARSAVADIQHMRQLSSSTPVALSFYRPLQRETDEINFKLFHFGDSLPLSDVLPILENLGLRVIDEHPYQIEMASECIWIHDFNLRFGGVQYDSLDVLQPIFEDAFLSIWQGRSGNDEFNKLVLGAGLNTAQVTVLRAYAAYMKQTRFPISLEAISAALNNHRVIARDLMALFNARFDPQQVSAQEFDALEKKILMDLDEVTSLNEDQVIRQYLALIKATLRTNAFQTLSSSDSLVQAKPCLSLKLAPAQIPHVPQPHPMFEIFVYSTRVEGVHLRGGKVARGGLRWSDRQEDYRTEVLGLVKAQQVKNAVIVPVGAKGGFIAKRLHPQMTRDQWLEEGIASYRVFISALLDLTDNLVEGQVLPPADLVRHDEDDTYLVVAADKGTATFSDIANEIAQSYGFWLGDAFASGGSQGYDHKKMGITARGAWVSVERHFREMGHNTRTQPFTVIGIGDMSGDVFGNGMLLSQQIQLVAAFNHQHIFIDPNPDPALSFKERQRLFQLPRSGWNDYDKSLISAGGGVFDRAAKSIALSAEIKQLTGLTVNRITPNELISALLQAPVDLLWNGGIGTYIKASSEQHTDVGDKANDALRVDAASLRCKVIGEGGNLGMTQKGRMEYARLGGRLNTDFIDNAGGVDCSDHEVNIKIMLNEMLAAGDLTLKQRNTLLQEMTQDVAALVLRNNYRQVQALTLAQRRSLIAMAEYQRFINKLEAQGKLKRSLEFIPNDEQLESQRLAGLGLSRPELSVLISYSKADLKERLLATDLPLDPYVARERATAFPAQLEARYPQAMAEHRLSREIVATQVANQIVNLMGINFVDRLTTSTGADVERVTRAYILVRDVFDVLSVWQEIEYLDYQVDADIQLEMMERLQYLVRHATRWFIRNRRGELESEQELQRFCQPLKQMAQELGELLCGEPRQEWEAVYERYRSAQVPEALAKLMAGVSYLFPALGVIEVALENGVSLRRAAEAFYAIGERLELHWFAQQLNGLEVDTYWQALARDAFRDDLDWQQRALMTTLLRYPEEQPIQNQIDQWVAQNQPLLERWDRVLADLKNAKNQDYAMYTVAVRELFDLARTCIYTQN